MNARKAVVALIGAFAMSVAINATEPPSAQWESSDAAVLAAKNAALYICENADPYPDCMVFFLGVNRAAAYNLYSHYSSVAQLPNF
jgi:hypothetical protein